MLKKTITYTDFDGNERNETFYFNLTQAEVAEMELSTKGGLAAKINEIIASEDNETIIALFKEIVGKAYGEKSADGKYFVKSKELRDAFMSTQAYSDLFMELATDSEAATAFINGIVPTTSNPPPKS
jgi:hypothetical protein